MNTCMDFPLFTFDVCYRWKYEKIEFSISYYQLSKIIIIIINILLE